MKYWTAADLPSFAGRTVIVTGANSGLGEVTAKELARVGASVILAVRNTAKGDAAAAGMTGGSVEVRKLDLQVKSHAAHPGYSATNLQSHSATAISGLLMSAGNALATNAAFGARQTLYAVSQDLPGDSFISPQFAMRGPTTRVSRSPLAKSPETAKALWELSEELTDTKFPL